MTPLLYGLGRVCVRRRWIVLAVWLVIFAALAVAARSVGPELNDNLTLPGSDSQAAADLLSDRFPSQANGTNPVVLTAPSGEKLTDAKYKKPIDDTVAASSATPTYAPPPARSPPRTSWPRTRGPATSLSTCARVRAT